MDTKEREYLIETIKMLPEQCWGNEQGHEKCSDCTKFKELRMNGAIVGDRCLDPIKTVRDRLINLLF